MLEEIINFSDYNNVAGIYIIQNMINGKYYVGSSCNISSRLMKHRSDLNRNKHFNRHLQFAWNKYGAKNFKFWLGAEVKELDHLRPLEQVIIETIWSSDSDCGYNKEEKPCNIKDWKIRRQRSKESHLGKKLSEAHKLSISKSLKGRVNNPIARAKARQTFLRKHGIPQDKIDHATFLYLKHMELKFIKEYIGIDKKSIYDNLKSKNINYFHYKNRMKNDP